MTLREQATRGAMDKVRRTAEAFALILDLEWDGLPDLNSLLRYERLSTRLQSEIAAIREARALPDIPVADAAAILAAGVGTETG